MKRKPQGERRGRMHGVQKVEKSTRIGMIWIRRSVNNTLPHTTFSGVATLSSPAPALASRHLRTKVRGHLVNGFGIGTVVPPPYSSPPTMQMGNKSQSQRPHVPVMRANFGPRFKHI